MVNGETWTSQHYALLFGALGSVHGWNRVGELIACIARVVLFLPALRYVDDYFSIEPAATAEHAHSCFLRLTRAILGQGALKQEKAVVRNPLPLLGLMVEAKKTAWSLR